MAYQEISYQTDAINEMLEYTNALLLNNKYDPALMATNILPTASKAITPTILLHATTGSGKTVIMTKFLNQIFEHSDLGVTQAAVIWLSISDGGIVKQSYNRVSSEANNLQCKTGEDVLSGSMDSLDAGTALFLGWDQLNSKDSKTGENLNLLMRETEGMNLPKLLTNTHSRGIHTILVIDESHMASTSERATEIQSMISPSLIINVTATPSKEQVTRIKRLTKAIDPITRVIMGKYIKIDTKEVIESGMIKEDLLINKGMSKKINRAQAINESPIKTILDVALQTRTDLRNKFTDAFKKGQAKDIEPLMLIQVPDAQKGDEVIVDVLSYLQTQGLTTESGEVACWFSSTSDDTQKAFPTKVNLENITDLSGKQKILLFKKSIATGWDCPRAYILVKFRESSAETPFSRQVVGRILRMPEQKKYPDTRTNPFGMLNKAYIYTNESHFTFEMDDRLDLSGDLTEMVNVYTTNVEILDKYKGLFEFATQLPLLTYSIPKTDRVLDPTRIKETLLTSLTTPLWQKMCDFAENNKDKVTIDLLTELEFAVDELENSTFNKDSKTKEKEADNTIYDGVKGKLKLQSSIIKTRVDKILQASVSSQAGIQEVKIALQAYRKFLIKYDKHNNPDEKSKWEGQPGVRLFYTVLYINQFNPALSRGVLKSTDNNFLLSFLRSTLSSCYDIPDHTISAENVTLQGIPEEATLEIVDAEDEIEFTGEDSVNKCLYGIMPNIKYKAVNDYINNELNVADNDVKWWFPNWVLQKKSTQIMLPYMTQEGLLNTVKPDLIVNRTQDGRDIRYYTFIVSTPDRLLEVKKAVKTFKTICPDYKSRSIDFTLVKIFKEEEQPDSSQSQPQQPICEEQEQLAAPPTTDELTMPPTGGQINPFATIQFK